MTEQSLAAEKTVHTAFVEAVDHQQELLARMKSPSPDVIWRHLVDTLLPFTRRQSQNVSDLHDWMVFCFKDLYQRLEPRITALEMEIEGGAAALSNEDAEVLVNFIGGAQALIEESLKSDQPEEVKKSLLMLKELSEKSLTIVADNTEDSGDEDGDESASDDAAGSEGS